MVLNRPIFSLMFLIHEFFYAGVYSIAWHLKLLPPIPSPLLTGALITVTTIVDLCVDHWRPKGMLLCVS